MNDHAYNTERAKQIRARRRRVLLARIKAANQPPPQPR
jgi:hypothetical protein